MRELANSTWIAVLFWGCASQPLTKRVAPERPALSVRAPAPPLASAAPPNKPASACAAECASGTTCALTKRGSACVECAPGSLPTCKDDRFVATCDDDGTPQTRTDCFAQHQRCESGICKSQLCTPNTLHCFDGNVQRCNATGSGRTLVTTCQTVDASGTLTLDSGVCQVRHGVPACHADCIEPDATILALFGCSTCEPPAGDFCASVGTNECNDRICSQWPDGRSITGPWPSQGPCRRETDGLAVPGSDRPGVCEGSEPIGTRVISYRVCRAGHALAAQRAEPCQR